MAAANAEGNAPTKYAEREVVITRVFDAPRALVFKAWTDPKHLMRWWGPKNFTNPVCEVDARVGGAWHIVMRSPDGMEYPCGGVYREIVEPERLVFTNIALDKDGNPIIDGLTTVLFAEEGGKTKLTLQTRGTAVVAYAAAYLAGMETGWSQSLDRLAERLAKTPIIIERTFNAPVAMVWKAITEIEHMKQWYMPELDSFKPEVGFETQFSIPHKGDDYLHLWKVTEVVPEKKIAYSWRYGGFPGDSIVTFELFAEGDKTKLRLTHEGLETFVPENNPGLARGNFLQGWTALGNALEQFLEAGRGR